MNQKIGKEAVEILKKRYSCRSFQNKPIEKEVLNDILEVGLNAATGGNIQAVSIIKVRDQELKNKVYELLPRQFVKEADTLLFYVLDYYRMMRWAKVEKAPFGRQYSFRDFIIELEDVMCVAQSIECASTLMGIGSVYMGGVNRLYDEFKTLLDLPKLTVPVLMVCMGYPGENGKKEKKKLSKKLMVHENTYNKLSDEEVSNEIVLDKYDNFLIKLPDEVLKETKENFYKVALEVNGAFWAEKVIDKLDEQKGINKAQNAFGKHYNPLTQHSYNKKIFDFFDNQGLHMLPSDDWFRKSEDLSE